MSEKADRVMLQIFKALFIALGICLLLAVVTYQDRNVLYVDLNGQECCVDVIAETKVDCEKVYTYQSVAVMDIGKVGLCNGW